MIYTLSSHCACLTNATSSKAIYIDGVLMMALAILGVLAMTHTIMLPQAVTWSFVSFASLELCSISLIQYIRPRSQQAAWEDRVLCISPSLKEGFCKKARSYALHKSHYQHILLATFLDNQNYHFFDFDGVWVNQYQEAMETWEEGSILIVMCCPNKRVEDLYTVERFIHLFERLDEWTEDGKFFKSKKPKILALTSDETARVRGGLAWPWLLRQTIFGPCSAALSYVI